MRAQLISLNYQVPHCDTTLYKFPVVIGYSTEAGICLEDPSISPYHCEIDLVDDQLVVRDLGSVHGTFVNSEPIDESVLNHGDELSIGMTTFLVKCSPAKGRYARGSSENVADRAPVFANSK
jgi:pSer/pThr/pTyr-binding forkhead associated (FHA) protein